jgi:hypothetical protein
MTSRHLLHSGKKKISLNWKTLLLQSLITTSLKVRVQNISCEEEHLSDRQSLTGDRGPWCGMGPYFWLCWAWNCPDGQINETWLQPWQWSHPSKWYLWKVQSHMKMLLLKCWVRKIGYKFIWPNDFDYLKIDKITHTHTALQSKME